jgi:ribosomal-protein-alanine N-acetyltransferase
VTPRTAAPVTVVPAGAESVSLLAELHRLAFPAGEAWGAEAIAVMLALPGSFALCAVADRGAEPDGFVLARAVADEAEILTLAVAPARRRRGIGTALLRGAIGEAARRGVRTLFLEVAEANEAARALYAAAGFAGCGRRRRYYADGGDALVLALSLSSCGSAAG